MRILGIGRWMFLLLVFLWADAASQIYQLNRSMSISDPNRITAWDWTVNTTYDLYWRNGQASGVRLPYYDINSSTYTQLNNGGNPDINTLDGWVLLLRDLGTPSSSPPVPYFLLYNKFRGIIRLFFYSVPGVGSPGQYVYGKMYHSYSSTDAFSFIDDKQQYAGQSDPSFKQVFSGTTLATISGWSYLEFDVRGYDPAASTKTNATFTFEIQTANTSYYEFAGSVNLTGELTAAGLSTSERSPSGIDVLKKGADSYLNGQKTFKEIADFLTHARGYADSNPSQWWANPLRSLVNSGTSAFLPGIGGIVGFITSSFGGTTNATPYIPLRWRHELSGTLKLSGTSTTFTPVFVLNVRVPGTPHTDPPGSSELPLYDSPLGVFAVRSVPDIECKTDAGFVPDYFVPDPYIEDWFGHANAVWTYALRDPINYAVNPSSGLVLVSMEAAYTNARMRYGESAPSAFYGNGVLNQFAMVSDEWMAAWMFSAEFYGYDPSWHPPSHAKIAVRAKFVPPTRTSLTPDTLVLIRVYTPTYTNNQNLNKPTSPPPPPLSATMSGPTSVYHPLKGQVNSGTWAANPSGGVGPYTFAWFWNGYSLGVTTQSYTARYGYDGASGGSSQFALQVNVTDSRSTLASATKSVTEYHSGGKELEKRAPGDGPLPAIPATFGINQNYPNPFNPSTRIRFSLPENSKVRIAVIDLLGREVMTLRDGVLQAGFHHVAWNGSDSQGEQVSSGLYFCRLRAVGESGQVFDQTIKMLLTR